MCVCAHTCVSSSAWEVWVNIFFFPIKLKEYTKKHAGMVATKSQPN